MKLNNKKQISSKTLTVVNFLLLVALVASLATNQFTIAKTNTSLGIKKSGFSELVGKVLNKKEVDANGVKLTGVVMDDAIKLVVSQGVPAVYGQEMAVSFDQVQQAINAMRVYDPDYGTQKITLSGDELKRYIDVAIKISCEYCCGAASIINQSGKAACGCAHSIAMRGFLAYLIKNHGAEYTNDQLLRELARWKGVYFPKQMIKKMAEQLQGKSKFTPDTAALIIDLKLPDYGGSSAPLPSEIENLPGMVGGC